MLKVDVPLGPVSDVALGSASLTRSNTPDSTLSLLTSMVAHAPVAQIICRANGRLVAANAAARSLLSPTQPQGLCPLWIKDSTSEAHARLTKRLHKIAGGETAGEVSIELGTGEWSFRAWPIDVLDLEGKRMLMLSLEGRSEASPDPLTLPIEGSIDESAWRRLGELEQDRRRLRREAQRLQRLCQTDPLTGVHNRSGFSRAVRKALLSKGAEGHLFFIDLDGFKAVNDHLGHATGDSVLRHVARALRGMVRSSDAIARLGGDEFAIWCQGGARDEITTEVIAATIEDACMLLLAKHAIAPISASVGVAHAPSDAHVYSVLLRVADARMYEAKEATQVRRL